MPDSQHIHEAPIGGGRIPVDYVHASSGVTCNGILGEMVRDSTLSTTLPYSILCALCRTYSYTSPGIKY